MHRTASAPLTARFTQNVASNWQARRWYYTPKTHRAYSVRQIAPGDRRLLAEFAVALGEGSAERDGDAVRELSDIVFDRVLATGRDTAAGFAALESTGAGDRVIGVAAYAPDHLDNAHFRMAVASSHRDEQVGRILLATLVRHAKRVGVRRIVGDMHWANRPMQLLAQSMGFTIEALPRDRQVRRLVLCLK
jgi:GNAT superfamily N-acetyltransferase